MSGLHNLSFWLLVIGGLNWLSFSLFNWDIGQLFGGADATISVVIYVIFGLAALFEIYYYFKK